MENLIKYELFEDEKMPGSGAAGIEAAPAIVNKVEFSISGVTPDAMQTIASLMAYVAISGDQQEGARIVRMAKDDPSGASSYIAQRIPGIIETLSCVDPSFKDKLMNQRQNLARAIVNCLPDLVAGMVGQISSQKADFSKSLKPDLSRSSYFSRLGGFLGMNPSTNPEKFTED